MASFVSGGVCAPCGFSAAGVHAGVKTHATWKKDVALIVSDVPCAAAGVFTTNRVKAAPLLVDREHLADGQARAIIANSGNANACAPNALAHATAECEAVAAALGCPSTDVLVSSTGVIGQELNVRAIEVAVPGLVASLARSPEASDAAAHAIMTTDTVTKEAAVTCEVAGATVAIGGIAKGSGMIHPNMGTMLGFLTTDCAIDAALLHEALLEVARVSFNRISVDGDTSTNDSCLILANGTAGNAPIAEKGAGYRAFVAALTQLCVRLARAMAADGEGARHLIECTVSGARTEGPAETIAKSVISSTLTKAAVFGTDANWGRVLCAMGYSGEEFDPEAVDVAFASAAGRVEVCAAGQGLPFDEAVAKAVLLEPEVQILIDLHDGDAACTCWGCDITYDYIRINGDYRT